MSDEPVSQSLPAFVGRFRIDAVLGRGAMGVVYKAYDPQIERPVAIKLVRADLLESEDRDEYLRRFNNEARIAGRCLHANIVAIYDFALHEGNPFLVLEYVEGVSLGQAFKRGTQASVSEVTHIALQVLDALSYAHAFGIIHRDIKPANILLTANGRLKVTDFGISRLASSGFTQGAMMVGTPSYMSPEQCFGGPVDQRCDLFSLGCVIYELLAGERAFSSLNHADVIYKLVNVPHPPLRDKRPDVPPQIAGIVDRALAKRADDRFASAEVMATAFRALSETETDPINRLTREAEEHETIVLSSSRAQISPPPDTSLRSLGDFDGLDESSVATIERSLARHIGPMARFHLRRAMLDAHSPDELCRLLGQLVPQEDLRDQFVDDAIKIITARQDQSIGAAKAAEQGSGASISRPISGQPRPAAEAIESITRALTHTMGPMARHLVRRALERATTLDELQALCLEVIDNVDERRRFQNLLADRGYPGSLPVSLRDLSGDQM